MLLFQKENWGKAYGGGRDSDISEFLDLSNDDASGSLLRGARKINVSDPDRSSAVHIRETDATDILSTNRTISSPHQNEPPEDDFMYQSVTYGGEAEKILLAAKNDQSSSRSEEGDDFQRRVSVTSL